MLWERSTAARETSISDKSKLLCVGGTCGHVVIFSATEPLAGLLGHFQGAMSLQGCYVRVLCQFCTTANRSCNSEGLLTFARGLGHLTHS